MTEKIRVGVVGSGIGRSHIRAYQTIPEKFDVVAICDIDQTRATEIAETHAIPRIVADMADLCQMDDVDVIDVCTPPFLHFSQTMQGLAAGKHVICEKPLTGSLKEIDELITAEAESGRRMMPIFQYRFGHGLQKLKKLVEAGLTGPAYLTTVETAWRRRLDYYTAVPWRGKWQTELGGVLVSHAIHAHDMMTYVLGPVKSVFARMTTAVNPIEVEDCVSASLEMADGSLASLSVTIGSAAEVSRHRFCFQNLSAESNVAAYRSSADPWVFTGDSPEINEQIEATLAQFESSPEGFVGQFSRFHQALHEDGELPVTLADARMAAELITAVYHSAATGQVVNLPIGKDHPKYTGWRPA
jgi:predicted dehydrogenase